MHIEDAAFAGRCCTKKDFMVFFREEEDKRLGGKGFYLLCVSAALAWAVARDEPMSDKAGELLGCSHNSISSEPPRWTPIA